jgi:hypothetical protein
MSEEPSAVTLYVPFNLSHRSQWRVLEGRHTIGVFASRRESLGFALRLADTIEQRRAKVVRLLVEESDGRWVQVAPRMPVDDCPELSAPSVE